VIGDGAQERRKGNEFVNATFGHVNSKRYFGFSADNPRPAFRSRKRPFEAPCGSPHKPSATLLRASRELETKHKKTNIERENKTRMSTLVVVGYDDPYMAEDVRLKLRKLQSEYLLDLEDAVVAVKDEKGKVKLHQAVNLTADGAVSGGFWGSLTGLICLNAATGAASGALTDVGINDHFMKELAASLIPGSSALFVLVRKVTPDTVLEELKGTGGRVLKTSLSHDDEAKLQAALSAARS